MKRVGNQVLQAIAPAVRDRDREGHRTGLSPGTWHETATAWKAVAPGVVPARKADAGGGACASWKGAPTRGHCRMRRMDSNRAGFTLVELLTVIAIVAVLATLLLSSAGGARMRSQQVACRNNLRQIAVAAEIYQDDTTRRPRSFTRLATRPSWVSNPRTFVCPSDPALKAAPKGRPQGQEGPGYWGNIANPSQEPPAARMGGAEEGSWEAELRETHETVAFSYLHPLGWRREAWMRLVQAGNQSGVSACELHGTRVPGAARRAFAQYEGQTLRVQRDGAVVSRRIFRTPAGTGNGPGNGGTTVAFPVQGDVPISAPADGDDYPWEFYTDGMPAALR